MCEKEELACTKLTHKRVITNEKGHTVSPLKFYCCYFKCTGKAGMKICMDLPMMRNASSVKKGTVSTVNVWSFHKIGE